MKNSVKSGLGLSIRVLGQISGTVCSDIGSKLAEFHCFIDNNNVESMFILGDFNTHIVHSKEPEIILE